MTQDEAIQFKYGHVNIISRCLLKDIVELLTAHEYVVGKIFPTSVDFRPYRSTDVDVTGPSYRAVRQSRQDLVALLA